jgi:hypothetical protein
MMDEEDRTLVGIIGAGHLGIARTKESKVGNPRRARRGGRSAP